MPGQRSEAEGSRGNPYAEDYHTGNNKGALGGYRPLEIVCREKETLIFWG
jgi:hypothetical protein